MDALRWLESWFARQCRPDPADNELGIKIESCDNPGWWVHVDLIGTDLEPSAHDQIIRVEGEPPSDGKRGGLLWMQCEIKGGKFSGAGDPSKLSLILEVFARWAQASASG